MTRQMMFVLIALLIVSIVPVSADPPKPATMPLMKLQPAQLNTAAAVRNLSRAAVEQKRPVLLDGVVTYSNPAYNDFFLQDRTGGIYVQPQKLITGLQPGDRLTVEGVTDPGDFAPCISARRIIRTGTAPLPTPVPLMTTLEGAVSQDAQYVSTIGIITQIDRTSRGNARMQLVTRIGPLTASIPAQNSPDWDAQTRKLVNAEVEVHGVCVPGFDERGRVTENPSLLIWSPDRRNLVVIRPPEKDPFDRPVQSIGDLFRFHTESDFYRHRIKVAGTVTAVWDDRIAVVEDDAERMTVRLAEPQKLTPGDRVELVGFVRERRNTSTLNQAIARITGKSALPDPIAIEAGELHESRNENRIVRFAGEVLEDRLRGDRYSFFLRDDSGVVEVFLEHAPTSQANFPLTPSSRVQVIGVLTSDTSIATASSRFVILLRSWDDVTLLSPPPAVPFWSTPRATLVLGAIAGVVITGFILIWTQRKTIRRQTRILQEKLQREQAMEATMRQSQKMQAIGRLAGGIAHDFNNLLTVINGSAELLPDLVPGGSSARELAGEILSAGQKAAGLVAQLLTFSRQRPTQLIPLNVAEVLRDIEKLLRRLIGEDLTLRTDVDTDLPRVLGEPILFQQVLVNLAVNARDAMSPGGILRIQAGHILLHDGRPGVRISVIDDGKGMSPEVQTRMFEPFFTTKEIGKGTGLGLATVYGIVQTLGGEVHVQSELGRGTTFHIDLPEAPEDVTVKDVEATPTSALRSLGQPRKKTVMLVEDDDAVRSYTTRVLELYGYTVVAAETPHQAIEQMQNTPIQVHLLITDVVMPEMGGRELADRVRELDPTVKVLFISGYTADEVLRRGIQEDEVEFLHKPFSPNNLVEKIEAMLKRVGKKSSIGIPLPDRVLA